MIASAALRPDACSAEINCRHAASDGPIVRVYPKLKSIARMVKDSSAGVNTVRGVATSAFLQSVNERKAARIKRRSAQLSKPALRRSTAETALKPSVRKGSGAIQLAAP